MELQTPELKTLERMLLERDLQDERELVFEAPGGQVIKFKIQTISNEIRREVKRAWDDKFPVPPLKYIQTQVGIFPTFDLEDQDYIDRLRQWDAGYSKDLRARALGISAHEFDILEKALPDDFLGKLFQTIELLNGIQSLPLETLVRDAVWAPEVQTWAESYIPDGESIKITDTPLFRQMDCIIASGLTLEKWEQLSARERLLYMAWYDAKNMKEAYLSWWQNEKLKNNGQRKNRHIR